MMDGPAKPVPSSFEADKDLELFVNSLPFTQLTNITFKSLVALRKMPPRWITWKVNSQYADLLPFVTTVSKTIANYMIKLPNWPQFTIQYEGPTLNGKPHGRGKVQGTEDTLGTKLAATDMSFSDGVADGRSVFNITRGNWTYEMDVMYENDRKHGFEIEYWKENSVSQQVWLRSFNDEQPHGVAMTWLSNKQTLLQEWREGASKFEKVLPADAFKPWTGAE